MPKSNTNGLLSELDDLFTTQEQRDEAKREGVMDIPLSEISDFPDHPFLVINDEAMQEMAESVKQVGVLVPAVVRPKEGGGYEMVAGHRRKMASSLAGLSTMPCIVRNLTDDEAIIAMVDANLQRDKILPSEKARAYKMKLDAMKRQGKRTDLGRDKSTFGILAFPETSDIIVLQARPENFFRDFFKNLHKEVNSLAENLY